jgi:hypothetical protein
MSGNPKECLDQARDCENRAELASDQQEHERLLVQAQTWRNLAAELEAMNPLLQTLQSIELDAPIKSIALSVVAVAFSAKIVERQDVEVGHNYMKLIGGSKRT